MSIAHHDEAAGGYSHLLNTLNFSISIVAACPVLSQREASLHVPAQSMHTLTLPDTLPFFRMLVIWKQSSVLCFWWLNERFLGQRESRSLPIWRLIVLDATFVLFTVHSSPFFSSA